jgi:hypothetical protein
MKQSTKALVIGAALAGLLGGTAARANTDQASDSTAKGAKASSDQKGAKNECKG